MSMGKGDETRRSILDQALRLASAQGLHQVTIGLLAEAAGLSKSGLFAHFRSKEQLQLAVLREASDRFVSKVLAPALREPRGEPRLRAFFENWVRWDSEEFPGGCPFQAAADELDDQPGPVRDYLVETQRDCFDSMATIARAGVEAGRLRADLDPRQLAYELFGIMLAFHHAHRLLRDPDADKRARTAFEALLERARPHQA
jgi:AcrR family transcriptional regulator